MANKNLGVIIPPMLSGDALVSALEVLPPYHETIRKQDAATRLMALSDLYQIYIPSQMSVEIYSKLYLALLRSLQKKGTQTAIEQRNQNYRAIRQLDYNGIIGGSDSFTIIGTSGIGKSSAINRAIDLISATGIIQTEKPYSFIIPCIVVQCPFDSSVKGLLLEILRKVDETLETKYYENAIRARATTDMLIGSVSQVALNHIGLLVVDEIQNVCNSRHGKSLVGMLTQLINNSGISICMVGTPESAVFFEQAMQLARRSLGLQYGTAEYNAYFTRFCEILFSYCYVNHIATLTEAITQWLYSHSGGVISVVVSLVHDAQEIAILNGKEELSLDTLSEAYQKRLAMLHGYIAPAKVSHPATKTENAPICSSKKSDINDPHLIFDLVMKAKNEQLDIVALLREHMTVLEVFV